MHLSDCLAVRGIFESLHYAADDFDLCRHLLQHCGCVLDHATYIVVGQPALQEFELLHRGYEQQHDPVHDDGGVREHKAGHSG